jgi:hypothetical protein
MEAPCSETGALARFLIMVWGKQNVVRNDHILAAARVLACTSDIRDRTVLPSNVLQSNTGIG